MTGQKRPIPARSPKTRVLLAACAFRDGVQPAMQAPAHRTAFANNVVGQSATRD